MMTPEPTWIIDLVVENVKRINIHYYYQLSKALTRIEFGEDSPEDVFGRLFDVERQLDKLLKTESLYLCHESALDLHVIIDECMKSLEKPSRLSADNRESLAKALAKLENAIEIQFDQLETYVATPKGTHDTRKLIANPSKSFSEKHWGYLSHLSQGDWAAGARCLAFGLPTACGFHIIRALEAVVRQYLELLGATIKKRGLGQYVELMKKHGVDKKAVNAVDQIRNLHRNPLMHPEDTLDDDEALDLFDLCKSAIKALLRDMEDKKHLPLPEFTPNELADFCR